METGDIATWATAAVALVASTVALLQSRAAQRDSRRAIAPDVKFRVHEEGEIIGVLLVTEGKGTICNPRFKVVSADGDQPHLFDGRKMLAALEQFHADVAPPFERFFPVGTQSDIARLTPTTSVLEITCDFKDDGGARHRVGPVKVALDEPLRRRFDDLGVKQLTKDAPTSDFPATAPYRLRFDAGQLQQERIEKESASDPFTLRRRLLEFMDDRHWQSEDLIGAFLRKYSHYPPQQVREHLSQLHKEGVVKKDRFGLSFREVQR